MADQRSCYALAAQQHQDGVALNPSGTIVGAAGAGAAAGVSDVYARFALEKRCLGERGYRLTKVTPAQAEVIDAGPAAEREQVVKDLMAAPG